METETNQEVVTLKDIISIIKRYKLSIILLTLIFTIGAFFIAYYKPNVYSAKATLQVSSNQRGSGDIVNEALKSSPNSDVDTEIAILSSRFLTLKTMQKINMTTHIWGVNWLGKHQELYINSPIKVKIIKGKDIKFKLTPIDKNSFKLEFNGNKKVSKYGNKISYKGVELIVEKTGKPFNKSYYEFIDYKPVSYAENLIHSNLKVYVVGDNSKVLQVTFFDTIPQRAKDFVNTLLDEYLKQNIKLKTKEATQTLNFINSQLNIIGKELKDSEQKLEKFKSKAGFVNVSANITNISKILVKEESQLAILDMQINMINDIVKNIKLNKSINTLTLIGTGVDANSINNLISELQKSILQKRLLLQEFTPEHPKIQELNTKIANLKVVIKKSISNILKSLQKKRALLLKEVKKDKKVIQKLPKVQQNYLALKRKYEFNEKFYKYLLEKKTEAEIKKAATVSLNRIIDKAILPDAPVQPNRRKIILFGFLIGLILGVLFAFLRGYIDDTIKEKDDVKKLTKTPILANIYHFKHSSDRKDDLVVLTQQNSYIAESFRSLRTNLMFMFKDDQNPKIISVTSTVSGEGKTTISANLAVVLQMLNKRVIIVNFDLRKPKLHELFGVENKRGLSGYLSGKYELDDIIKPTNRDGLDIITSGQVPPNPSELIASKRSEELLRELKRRYDYIILDTPPVGIVTDAKVLLSKTDMVLYVIKAYFSKKDFIENIELLKKDGIENINIIINNLKNRDDYGYKYGYYK